MHAALLHPIRVMAYSPIRTFYAPQARRFEVSRLYSIFYKGVQSSNRTFHTTSPQAGQSWGGGKIKTHSGTAKRFRPVGKRKGAGKSIGSFLAFDEAIARGGGVNISREGGLESASAIRNYGSMFKRAQTGKRHLNSKMSSVREMRLRRAKVHRSGPTVRVLGRLLAGRY